MFEWTILYYFAYFSMVMLELFGEKTRRTIYIYFFLGFYNVIMLYFWFNSPTESFDGAYALLFAIVFIVITV